jgi:hypothetical protein
MAMNNRAAATTEEVVHSPGSSKTQERRNSNENPSITVIAVMTPERYPAGR